MGLGFRIEGLRVARLQRVVGFLESKARLR